MFLKFACYFSIGFFILCTVLSFMGRQTFSLHTSTEYFERAIYAEEHHSPHSRSLTVHMGDDIRVWTGDTDQIDRTTQLSLIHISEPTRPY